MAMLLTEEQRMLQDSARDFFANQVEIGAALRKLRDERPATGFDPSIWERMVELGWAAIPWPEDFGGLEFGYKGLGVVTEEAGRRLTVSPLFASVWLGGTLVNIGGDPLQKQTLLPALATGELLLATALDERPHHAPFTVETTAVADGDGFRISGTKTFVLDGAAAQRLIVVARTAGDAGDRHGITLFLVDRATAGVDVRPALLADSRSAARISFTDVAVGRDAVLGDVDAGADVLERGLDIARVGLAAELLGSLQTCFEMTLEYLKTRQQFDVPIGSFQGLKHRAAQMYCEVELSRSVVLEALTAIDEQRPAEELARLASLAKCQVGEAFNGISREGVQMHGGIGMTDEFDIGFFLKRSGVADATLGGQDFHRNRYGTLTGC